MLRTHTCGELSIKDIKKEVTLCGWVHSRRDHGKLIFIDIRDRYGLTQVVFNPKEDAAIYKKASELRSEYVIKLRGIVNPRPKGTENPKISTGDIEISAQDLEIINSSLTIPFEISQSEDLEVSEEIRLKYRYIDLRRPKMLNNLVNRHNLYKAIRTVLDREGFIEVETPILTKSTPEGARDYLVPSRLNKGEFYALPQSPQLFKQILMVAGLERYFQIARCFRDEDLRSDRQPEFTQLDIEMSFINEEDIISTTEKLIQNIFKTIKGIDLKIPFVRMSHRQAMEKYGSDKPDLRNVTKDDFAFVWVVDFPLFKYNEEEKRWDSEHHPFTSPKEDDINFLESQPGKVRAKSYDLVLNGMEVASGSIRIHNRDLQAKIFSLIGISKNDADERFGFLLEAFNYGCPPHGGIAIGLDRFLAILLGEESIRDVIAFPKTQKAICPLTSAPSSVEGKQLEELGIKIIKQKEV